MGVALYGDRGPQQRQKPSAQSIVGMLASHYLWYTSYDLARTAVVLYDILIFITSECYNTSHTVVILANFGHAKIIRTPFEIAVGHLTLEKQKN